MKVANSDIWGIRFKSKSKSDELFD